MKKPDKEVLEISPIDADMEKLAQKWAKKWQKYDTKIGNIRDIIKEAYDMGFKDAVTFFNENRT